MKTYNATFSQEWKSLNECLSFDYIEKYSLIAWGANRNFESLFHNKKDYIEHDGKQYELYMKNWEIYIRNEDYEVYEWDYDSIPWYVCKSITAKWYYQWEWQEFYFLFKQEDYNKYKEEIDAEIDNLQYYFILCSIDCEITEKETIEFWGNTYSREEYYHFSQLNSDWDFNYREIIKECIKENGLEIKADDVEYNEEIIY